MIGLICEGLIITKHLYAKGGNEKEDDTKEDGVYGKRLNLHTFIPMKSKS